MNYRFEPTGEVRVPAFNELIEVDGEVIRSIDKQPSMKFPIYRRVEHDPGEAAEQPLHCDHEHEADTYAHLAADRINELAAIGNALCNSGIGCRDCNDIAKCLRCVNSKPWPHQPTLARVNEAIAVIKDYRRYFDGDGVESDATIIANERALVRKKQRRIEELEREILKLKSATSCEVAFARMCCAYKSFEHQHDGAVHALYKRMCDGERSPELTASMQALTERMKGST